MFTPDTTPPITPGSSPCDMGILLLSTIAGMFRIITFSQKAAATGSWPRLGYGTGMGLGAAGVLQTSGTPRHMPAWVEDAGNIRTLLSPRPGRPRCGVSPSLFDQPRRIFLPSIDVSSSLTITARRENTE